MFEHITANEIAGYTVGALLLSATVSAPKIDAFISSSQRRSLGMCKRCGDVKLIACSKCKGSGLIKEGGPFNLTPIVQENRAFRVKTKMSPSSSTCASCHGCGAKGNFPCPECSEGWSLQQRLVVCSSQSEDSVHSSLEEAEVDNLGVKAALSMLRFYKKEISPLLPNSCRYVPTCSEYSMIAYKKYGVVRGTILTAWRLCRCNPLGGSGFDPPRWFDEPSPPKQ